MYPNWPVTLHLRLLCLAVVVGAQMFAQPLTKNRSGSHSPLTIESAAGQMIEEAALQQHLQQFTGSQALAPLLLQLVGQTMPNWQEYQQPKYQEQQQLQQATNQPQQQQKQQQQAGQQFFVYESAAASQQPQILAGFNGVNGVNGRPGTLEQLQQQLQQQQLLPKPIQAQQQQEQYAAESRPKIVKAPPAAAVWAPALSNPPQQLNQQQPPTTPSLATGAAPGSCQLCCNPSEPATPSATPCPPSDGGGDGGHEIVPLLSATALKAAVG